MLQINYAPGREKSKDSLVPKLTVPLSTVVSEIHKKNAESMSEISIERNEYSLLFWRFLGARVFSVIRRKPHPLLLWRLKKRNMKFVTTEEKMQCNKLHKIDFKSYLVFLCRQHLDLLEHRRKPTTQQTLYFHWHTI